MAIIKIRNAAIDLDAAEIPNLPASKITSGTLDNARISLDAAEIPNLDTAKITSGTLADARVPDLNASKITAGTIATARLGSGTASSSTFLRGDGTFAEAASSGRILQVVSSTDITERGSTSTSYGVHSNTLSVDITPASTSSTILLLLYLNAYNSVDGGSSFFTIYRDTSDLGYSNKGLTNIKNAGNTHTVVSSISISTFDQPSTTSQVTYGLNFRTGSGHTYINYNNSKSRLTALEIGA